MMTDRASVRVEVEDRTMMMYMDMEMETVRKNMDVDQEEKEAIERLRARPMQRIDGAKLCRLGFFGRSERGNTRSIDL